MKVGMDKTAEEAFDKAFPRGTLPHESLNWLTDYYNDLELKRLKAWGMLRGIRDDIVELKLPVDTTPLLNSTAQYDGGILKIIIDDYIPRKSITKVKEADAPLRNHWLRSVVDPIRKLQASGIILQFDKALCIIKTYVPRDITRDVDNVAYKIILDGLRYTRIIKDDTWKQMAFMVAGDIDRKAPRTEIYVIAYSKIMEILAPIFTPNNP